MMLAKLPGLEIKSGSVEPDGSFTGYAAVFGAVDAYSDIIEAGAFAKSLSQNRRPKLLREHDRRHIIGGWKSLEEDDVGLKATGQLFIKDVAEAKETHALMLAGELDGLSIGFKAVEADYRETDDEMIRVLREIDLKEVSIVAFPAMEDARIDDVKTLLAGGGAALKRGVEQYLREAGFPREEAKAMAGAASSKFFEMREASDPAVRAVKSLADLRKLIQE